MVSPSRTGRRRLRILLSLLFGGLATLAIALVLVGYKLPYSPVWWIVLAAVELGAFLGPLALVPAIEWVMRGYAERDGE